MNKSYVVLFIVCSICMTSALTAQTSKYNEEERGLCKFMLNVHAFEPALNFQYGVSKNLSLVFQGGLTGGLLFAYNNGMPSFYYYLSPKALGEFRFYYNLNKRAQKGKMTSRHSGNFIALHAHYIFRPLLKNFSEFYPGRLVAGPVWGIQRTTQKGFNFNFYTGPAVSIAEKANYVKRGGIVRYGNNIRFNIVVGVTIGGTVFSSAKRRKEQRIIDFAD